MKAVCLFDIPLPQCCVAQGTRLFLRTARFHFPAFPPFHPLSHPRLAVLKFGVPRLSVCNPLLHAGLRWLSWRSPSCIDAHVPEQGPSTATLPSFQLLRPWLPVAVCQVPGPPPSTKLTAQAGWRIGSE